jgi:insulysin
MVQNMISLLCRSEHPLSRFTVGTVETLIERPRRAGLDVGSALSTFFEQHYTPNVMSLVIYAHNTLDELQKLVEK